MFRGGPYFVPMCQTFGFGLNPQIVVDLSDYTGTLPRDGSLVGAGPTDFSSGEDEVALPEDLAAMDLSPLTPEPETQLAATGPGAEFVPCPETDPVDYIDYLTKMPVVSYMSVAYVNLLRLEHIYCGDNYVRTKKNEDDI